MDLIRIRGLEIDCIVGVRPLEREREQRVHIDLALGMDLSPAGRTGRIALTCDYDEIAGEVIALLRFRRYHLIEMATEEITAMLLGVHPALEMVDIRLDKPAALDGRARAASVEVKRTRADFGRAARPAAFGSIDALLETLEAGLYLFSVHPSRKFVPAEGPEARTLEWLVSGDLECQGTPLPRHSLGAGNADSSSNQLVYTNPGNDVAVLFRCICPPMLDVEAAH
jgi:dihydroneopterin aldolase